MAWLHCPLTVLLLDRVQHIALPDSERLKPMDYSPKFPTFQRFIFSASALLPAYSTLPLRFSCIDIICGAHQMHAEREGKTGQGMRLRAVQPILIQGEKPAEGSLHQSETTTSLPAGVVRRKEGDGGRELQSF